MGDTIGLIIVLLFMLYCSVGVVLMIIDKEREDK
jgi:hypothetical protein